MQLVIIIVVSFFNVNIIVVLSVYTFLPLTGYSWIHFQEEIKYRPKYILQQRIRIVTWARQ